MAMATAKATASSRSPQDFSVRSSWPPWRMPRSSMRSTLATNAPSRRSIVATTVRLAQGKNAS